jgi:aquaporin Z
MVGGYNRYAAEFLGALVLVFGGTTAIVAANTSTVPVLIVVPFAFGLALLAGLYAFGEVSGGHFNPAVSIAMFLDGRLALPDLIGYVVAQLAGAVAGSLLLLFATSQTAVATTATVPGAAGDWTAFELEVVFTAIFVAVILQASRSDKFGTSALLAIPLALTTVHFALIPFSGSSVNPARSFGPALVGNEWSGFWIYVIAPPLGAAIAWAIHRVVVRGYEGATTPAVAEVLTETPPPAATVT